MVIPLVGSRKSKKRNDNWQILVILCSPWQNMHFPLFGPHWNLLLYISLQSTASYRSSRRKIDFRFLQGCWRLIWHFLSHNSSDDVIPQTSSPAVFRNAKWTGRESSMGNILNDRILKPALVSRYKWCRSFILWNQIDWNRSRNALTSEPFGFTCCSDLSARPVVSENGGVLKTKSYLNYQM